MSAGTRPLCTEGAMTVQTSRSPAAIRAAAATAHPAAAPRQAWLIIALLFLFMVINFADKAVIGIAAMPIMDELLLSPREFGLLGSSFFLLFAVSAVVTGFIVNRVETRWALLVMGLVWALTQFPMLGSVGFATIIAARIALGAGEGPAYPVALHSAYKWFPNELRTLPTAIVAQGAGIGIMVALPLLNWVIVRYSWHWAFGVLGIAGAAVVVLIAAGWYSQRLLARGVSSRVARGILGGGCVALGGMALAVMPYVPGIPAKIALTTIGIAVPSVINVISHTVVSELTPVAQRGALLAIGTAIGTSAGLLAPYIMGSIVETAATPLAGFNTGFMICGVIMLVGGLIGMALIRPERDALRWTNPIAVAAAGPA